eukprot:GCRY01003122.1.p1 GENE.GCRY01003122.1~~GCRY01003122.1.p1  ORF type:complete len:961 (+),score=314.90 GCRY01003122.1:189-3071(+)
MFGSSKHRAREKEEEEELPLIQPAPQQSQSSLYSVIKEEEKDGDGDLDTLLKGKESVSQKRQNLFERLRTRMETSTITPHLETFESEVKDDVLYIGSISLEEAEAQERLVIEERERAEKQHQEREAFRLRRIEEQEKTARERIWREAQTREKMVERKQRDQYEKDVQMAAQIEKAFIRAEDKLKHVLQKRQGELETHFGELATAGVEETGPVAGRRWRVDWTRAPQPIRIRLHAIRSPRDRLTAGKYVLMVSLYDRLGGGPLRWSRLRGQEWAGSTLPVAYDGSVRTLGLTIDQTIHTVCPSQPEIKPAMLFVFELFKLRGPQVPTDQVVGWGCFPMATFQFEIIKGCFKVPLLRGGMDPAVNSHGKYLNEIYQDLDNWLGNLYFEVEHLPRYIAGQREYEVELLFSSKLLGHPNRTSSSSAPNTRSTPANNNGPNTDLEANRLSEASRGTTPPPRDSDETAPLLLDSSASSSPTPEEGTGSTDPQSRVRHGEIPGLRDVAGVRGFTHTKESIAQPLVSPFAAEEELPLATLDEEWELSSLSSDSGSEGDENNEQGTSFPRNRGEDHSLEGSAGDWAGYRFETAREGEGRRGLREAQLKIIFLKRQVLSELGLSQWKTVEFWATVVLLFAVFYLRMFSHFLGQYLFLYWFNVPMSEFSFQYYYFRLDYGAYVLPLVYEIVMTGIGTIFNIILFGLFVAIARLSQLLLGSFVDGGSRFIMSFGMATCVDPLLILICDLIAHRWNGDLFKLFNRFDKQEGNGAPGVLLTVFICGFLMMATLGLLYEYFLHVHMDGRLMDLYQRLLTTHIVIPFDMEVSVSELVYATEKAERWRGSGGERRKTKVVDYKVTDPDDPTFAEKSTHVAIYTLFLNGRKELYRHFLRLPDGQILELTKQSSLADITGHQQLLATAADGVPIDLQEFLRQRALGSPPPTPAAEEGGQLVVRRSAATVSRRGRKRKTH